MTSPSPPKASIPAVFIGVTRKTALDSSTDLFKTTPYYTAAALDMTESPQEYQFSAQNLGAVLYTLHPRPQILVTGTALDAETVASIEPIWAEYAEFVGGKACWVALSKTHGQPGPPPPGIGEEVMKQLDAVFRPEIRHDR